MIYDLRFAGNANQHSEQLSLNPILTASSLYFCKERRLTL